MKLKRVRLLHEVALSLNVGFAVGYSFFVYLHSSTAALLAQRLTSKVEYVFDLNQNSVMGMSLIFILLMLGISLFVFLILLLLRLGTPSMERVALGPLACFVALAAVPGCWLYAIILARPGIVYIYNYPRAGRVSGILLLGLEVSATLTLLFLARRHNKTTWSNLALLSFHYVFWGWYLWPDIGMRFWLTPGLRLSAIAFPCSGLLWFLYIRTKDTTQRSEIQLRST